MNGNTSVDEAQKELISLLFFGANQFNHWEFTRFNFILLFSNTNSHQYRVIRVYYTDMTAAGAVTVTNLVMKSIANQRTLSKILLIQCRLCGFWLFSQQFPFFRLISLTQDIIPQIFYANDLPLSSSLGCYNVTIYLLAVSLINNSINHCLWMD